MSTQHTTILTDINIEDIVGKFRNILQERALQIERDMTDNERLTLELDFKVNILKHARPTPSSPDTAEATVTMTYVPVTRRAVRRLYFEDHRQEALPGVLTS